MQSASFIPPAYLTHSDIFYSNNPLSYVFNQAAFPEGSTFSSYVRLGDDTVPMAIAPDPVGNLKVRAEFVMASSGAFKAYPIPEGDRYPHQCEPSPLQRVSLGVVSYQNAAPGQSAEESFLVLKGGVHASEFRSRGNYFLTRERDARLHFLSRQPVARRVHPLEPCGLLYLANLTPLKSVDVCVRMYNGTGHEDRVIDTLQLAENAAYYIPTDVKSLGIDSTVYSYEVFLLDPERQKRYSEVRRYYVDRRPHKRVFIVAYENALGYYETLYFFGDDTLSERITQSDQISLVSDAARSGQRTNVEGNPELTLRSGFFVRGLEDAFRELLYSPDVYLITPGGNVPVNVKSDSLVLPAGEAPEYAAELTFTLDAADPFPLHQPLFFES